MKPSVLIVEDDIDVAIEISTYLKRREFAVRHAQTIAAAELELEIAPDLLLLDINLPDGSGLDLFARLNGNRHTGVVMFTARSERELRIASLMDGADAYLVKPVDPLELEATLLSVHRRLQSVPVSPLLLRPKIHPWCIDLAQSLLTAPNGVTILLRRGEASLLDVLFSEPSHTASRDQLKVATDYDDDGGAPNRFETLISRLRRKVADKAGLKLPIVSQYGHGYSFNGTTQVVR